MSSFCYKGGILACDTKGAQHNGCDLKHPVAKMTVQKHNGEWTAFAGTGNPQLKMMLRDWLLSAERKPRLYPKPSQIDVKGMEDDTVVVLASTYQCLVHWYNNADIKNVLPRFKFMCGGTGENTMKHYHETDDLNAIELVVKAIKAAHRAHKRDKRWRIDSDWPVQWWMPGMDRPGIITESEWSQYHKSHYRKLRFDELDPYAKPERIVYS